jgi:hypothetical protein
MSGSPFSVQIVDEFGPLDYSGVVKSVCKPCPLIALAPKKLRKTATRRQKMGLACVSSFGDSVTSHQDMQPGGHQARPRVTI